jgi:hypothetical protein
MESPRYGDLTGFQRMLWSWSPIGHGGVYPAAFDAWMMAGIFVVGVNFMGGGPLLW